MKIRKDGIFKTIDSKDFGIFQTSGWEKVVVDVEPKKVKKSEPIVEEKNEIEEEPIIPKPKKKKKV